MNGSLVGFPIIHYSLFIIHIFLLSAGVIRERLSGNIESARLSFAAVVVGGFSGLKMIRAHRPADHFPAFRYPYSL